MLEIILYNYCSGFSGQENFPTADYSIWVKKSGSAQQEKGAQPNFQQGHYDMHMFYYKQKLQSAALANPAKMWCW